MKYVCIFTRHIYGHSGNELPPPVITVRTFAVLSNEGETLPDFVRRMSDVGMAKRINTNDEFAKNPKPYSMSDAWTWSIHQVGES
jgi:hypothetical protein